MYGGYGHLGLMLVEFATPGVNRSRRNQEREPPMLDRTVYARPRPGLDVDVNPSARRSVALRVHLAV